MARADEPPALAYIERTIADNYRKEIDQEENVWRSLPFFAAALALQLSVFIQIIDKLADPATIIGRISIGALAIAAALTYTSLVYVIAAIAPQRFEYVAKQKALLPYAQALIEREEEAVRDAVRDGIDPPDSLSALVTLKNTLAQQYAEAADNNQQINKRRERRRSIAGMAALLSMIVMLILVGLTTFAHYVHG